MRLHAPLVVAACLLIAADPPAARNDPQAKFEPRSGPGAGQKLLAEFAGDWDVVKIFHPRTGEPVRAVGECRQRMIHDGRFLQSDFVFREGQRATTGMGLIGFEPESGTFTSFWTDSRQTRMSVRQSRDKFDGTQIVLYSRSLEADGKEARRSKTVSRIDADRRTLIHRQFSLGPDGEERLMMELIMTRKATASSASQ